MLRKVRAAMLRKGAAPGDVDDLVQEAFARVESYARKHAVRSHEAMLMTTAANLGRDEARARARRPAREDAFDLQALVDDGPRPEEWLLIRERLRRLHTGMRQLEPQTRRCLLAKRLDGLTAAQVAEREHLSVAAVEKRVARALVFLTRWVGET